MSDLRCLDCNARIVDIECIECGGRIGAANPAPAGHIPQRCHYEHERQSNDGAHLYDPTCLFCIRPTMDRESGEWSFSSLPDENGNPT